MACTVFAAARYPGGTWYDPSSPGHSFWRNFLCDLMQSHALDGQPAGAGAIVARIGLFAALAGFAAFYVHVGSLESTRLARRVRRTGLIACVLGCAIPMAPSDRDRAVHLVAVTGAFLPALVATIAAFVVCLRAPAIGRWTRLAAAVGMGALAIDGLAYLYDYAWAYGLIRCARPHALESLLPAFQRVGSIGMVAWLVGASTRRLPSVSPVRGSTPCST